jgi:hypothetical protein
MVDDLRSRSYQNISVLDVSQTAIEVTTLGGAAEQVHCIVADITDVELDSHAYDVWHDRAVFYFLTSVEQRAEYVKRLAPAVRTGGRVTVGTFGPEGPTKCGGLDVVRHDAEFLHDELGTRFGLIESVKELQKTPFGTAQQLLDGYCRLE